MAHSGLHTNPLTAFPRAVSELKWAVLEYGVDFNSLHKPLRRCGNECLGACCYDGGYLMADEPKVIEDVVARNRTFFVVHGIDLSGGVVVPGRWPTPGVQTAVVPRAFSKLISGFPPHFRDTACVFLTERGECSLQLLSVNEGKHPWYYKPTGCWLHPLTTHKDGRQTIALENADTDPFVTEDYPGFVESTFCGRTAPGGELAQNLLRPELDYLETVTGVAIDDCKAVPAQGTETNGGTATVEESPGT